MKNKVITVIFCIALVLFMLTFCIALPIYCRFFYYIQIKTLGMEERTGWSYEVIKQAYDEVLNFCTLPGGEFSAGQLAFSEEGAAHFADCKFLFGLNLGVLLTSGAILIAIIVLHAFKKVKILSFKGHHAYFYSALVAVTLPVVLGLLISIDFDKAFEIFHMIFFPGKSNWVFNPRTDQIILVMPEQFFMNCAIFIGVSLVIFAAALIACDLIIKIKNARKVD